MASERQRAANRRNAGRSTGPRTASGKAGSRQNALRHGLSSRLGSNSDNGDRIEALARILAGSEASYAELHYARIAAEATLQITRIRALRTTLLDPAAREREVFSWSMPKKVHWRRHYKAGNLSKAGPRQKFEALADKAEIKSGGDGNFGRHFMELAAPLERFPPVPSGAEAPLVILERFISKVVKLDRYEDRELSRRKAALRALDVLQL